MASSTSQAMPATATAAFNPADVSAAVAATWCSSQLQSCPEICGGTASSNTCDTTSFTYTCICSDGSVPDCTAYTGTLPFYICQATFSQCIGSNPNDAAAQVTCTANEVCGTKDPASVPAKSSTTSSSTSSASASSKSISTTQTLQTPATSSTTLSVPVSPASKSTTESSTSAASSSSGISSISPAPTNEASSVSRGLAPGDIAGIGIGCALGALLIAGLIAFFLWRRRKSRSKAADQTTPHPAPTDPQKPEKTEKTELYGDLAQSPSSGLWSVDIRDKPEMFTNANRHEMEQSVDMRHRREMATNANRHEMGDTGVAATLARPWSAELPEHRHV